MVCGCQTRCASDFAVDRFEQGGYAMWPYFAGQKPSSTRSEAAALIVAAYLRIPTLLLHANGSVHTI